jgi:hypothetical protein
MTKLGNEPDNELANRLEASRGKSKENMKLRAPIIQDLVPGRHRFVTVEPRAEKHTNTRFKLKAS